MGKLDNLREKIVAEMTGRLNMKSVDKKLLTAISKSPGPSLYKADSEKAACSIKMIELYLPIIKGIGLLDLYLLGFQNRIVI